jgi:hypothetical protein
VEAGDGGGGGDRVAVVLGEAPVGQAGEAEIGERGGGPLGAPDSPPRPGPDRPGGGREGLDQAVGRDAGGLERRVELEPVLDPLVVGVAGEPRGSGVQRMPQTARASSRSSAREEAPGGAQVRGLSMATTAGARSTTQATAVATSASRRGPATTSDPRTAQPWNPLRRPPTSMPTAIMCAQLFLLPESWS